MADATAVTVSEVLCYIQNNLGKHPKNAIRTVVVAFYDDDEVVSAKQTLFKFAEALPVKPDNLPRLIRRTANDNKRKQDCDDMLNMYSCLDEAKVPLPMFAAVNLSRVPSVNPGEVDVYAISSNVSTMSSRIDDLSSSMSELRAQVETILNVKDDLHCLRGQIQSVSSLKDDVIWPRIGASTGSIVKQPVRDSGPTTDTPDGTVINQVVINDGVCPQNQQTNVTDVLMMDPTRAYVGHTSAATGSDVWNTVHSRSKHAQSKPTSSPTSRTTPPIRFRGSKSDVSLKSVPRQEVLSAFVGRLHPETTEEQLTAYLLNEGMKGVVCRRLIAKNGKKFNTAAFQVTCCLESRDIFYDENSCPSGIELRDWVYYSK